MSAAVVARVLVLALVMFAWDCRSAVAQSGSATADQPAWATSMLADSVFRARFAIDGTHQPSQLAADFDGDGNKDLALRIRHRGSGKRGIALLLSKGRRLTTIGAGRDFGNGGDDWEWVDNWRVEIRTPDGARLPGKHDVLFVEKRESAGAYLWWDGRRWRWTQHGD